MMSFKLCSKLILKKSSKYILKICFLLLKLYKPEYPISDKIIGSYSFEVEFILTILSLLILIEPSNLNNYFFLF